MVQPDTYEKYYILTSFRMREKPMADDTDSDASDAPTAS